MDALFDPTLRVQMICNDPDEFQERAAGWDIQHRQLAPGKYQINLNIIHSRNVQLSDVSHQVGVREQGYIPLDACAICLPTFLEPTPLYFCGTPLEENECPALLSGEEFDSYSSGTMNYVTLVAKTSLLEREALLLTGQPFSSLRRQLRIRISQQNQQRLKQLIRTLMYSLDSLGINQQPVLEKQLVEQLILSILPPSGEDPKLPNRRVVAKQAEQTIRQHIQQQLSIEQICSLVGCSMRTLHLGFKECYGTTPGQYARTMALNAVQRQLSKRSSNETITDVAMRWGFYHLGRFSQQYTELFNELPSETVKRCKNILPPQGSTTFSDVLT